MNSSKQKSGVLIWITGLPGSGKTTLAKEVHRLLRNKMPVVLMDGDIFREIMGNDLGYSQNDRLKNAQRLARMNHYLLEHGISVVCSTVSLYKEIHAWNRKYIKNLIEVLIHVPAEILKKRDSKKLYSRAESGRITDLVGIHQTFDMPKKPDMSIANHGSRKIFLAHAKSIAQRVLASSDECRIKQMRPK